MPPSESRWLTSLASIHSKSFRHQRGHCQALRTCSRRNQAVDEGGLGPGGMPNGPDVPLGKSRRTVKGQHAVLEGHPHHCLDFREQRFERRQPKRNPCGVKASGGFPPSGHTTLRGLLYIGIRHHGRLAAQDPGELTNRQPTDEHGPQPSAALLSKALSKLRTCRARPV